MNELGLASLDDYRARLALDPDEWAVLDRLCRITISRFWRDREVFERLRLDVLPSLASSDVLSVWSAGCASGEEPYSVALAWHFGTGASSSSRLRVLGTDVDEALLARARRAIYSRATLRELRPEWIERAFIDREDEMELRPEMREGIEFREHDIRSELPAETFSIISCRNLVLTYFDPLLRNEVLGRIIDRLAIGGALVVGIHETVPVALRGRVAPWDHARAVYRRTR